MTFRSLGDGLDRSTWLFVLLVVVTLLPAAFVLWFMNEAISTQAGAARQRVLEAYRGQLRLVQSRIDAHWRDQVARLDGTGRPEQRFLRLIEDGTAEGALFLADDAHVEYPDRIRAGSLVTSIEGGLAAIQAGGPSAEKAAIARLADQLNDYTTPLAATERLMLMERLRALAPNVFMPTQAALRLSMDLIEAERPTPTPDALRETTLRGVWALTSRDSRVIALYRTGRLEAMMHDYLHQVQPAGIVFIATPPDVPASAEAIAAGAWMPGWQVTFQPIDESGSASFDDAVRRQRTMYISVALGGVAVMTVVGAVGGGLLRRHLQLARVKTDLVAAASHELRTPLASMRVLVDGLLADPVLDPTKTREYLELIGKENARLSRLIENFLTFSRLERERYRFEFGPTQPVDVVASAVSAVRERMPTSCDLQVDVAPSLPSVMADGDALSTALINLLDNALKYTPESKRILVRAHCDGDGFVSFAVQDNGIGIPAREQRRIFRRFYQIDQRLSRETAGVGLGLSIVELIVRAHRGTVSVRSEPGAGSVFTLRVPASGGQAA